MYTVTDVVVVPCLFIALTSRLEAAVGEDLMTSRAAWQEIIAQCTQRHQELEQDEHRDVACSVESLSAAVCDVFRRRELTGCDSMDDTNDAAATVRDADDDDDAEQGRETEEYRQILD